MRRSLIVLILAGAIALTVPAAAGAASAGGGAQKLLITATDLPAGWTASAHDSTGDDAPAKAIAACSGRKIVKKKVTLISDDIMDPSGNFSTNDRVTVYATPALAKKQFAAYASPKYRTCAKAYFSNAPFGGAGGPLPTAVEIKKISLGSYGEKRVGYALRADVPEQDGTSVSVYSVQVAILKGRVIVKAQFDGNGDVFSQDDGEAVLAAIDKRLDKANI